jgi:hypothetical protein
MIAVCFENYMNNVNAKCGKKVDILILEQLVHILTTVLKKVFLK